jgi:hypothetical protein
MVSFALWFNHFRGEMHFLIFFSKKLSPLRVKCIKTDECQFVMENSVKNKSAWFYLIWKDSLIHIHSKLCNCRGKGPIFLYFMSILTHHLSLGKSTDECQTRDKEHLTSRETYFQNTCIAKITDSFIYSFIYLFIPYRESKMYVIPTLPLVTHHWRNKNWEPMNHSK